jgi:heat shock protein HtpX
VKEYLKFFKGPHRLVRAFCRFGGKMLNTLKVGLMLTALTALLMFMGRLAGGPTGMAIAFGLAIVMNVGSYWFSDKIVLKIAASAVSRIRARTVSLDEDLGSVPSPSRVSTHDDPQPQPFATPQPQNSAVAVGAAQFCRKEWKAGAHERRTSIKNKHRDTPHLDIVAGRSQARLDDGRFRAHRDAFGGGNTT